ncbi:MAG: hypothetical protein J7K85_09395 [Anaerolineaceae bacterium]|nr:hypothetical protein [Anaerolineaceae bacterium]
MRLALFSFLHHRRVLVLSIAVVLLCLAALTFIQGNALLGKTDLFTMQTAFSTAKMETILSEWGEEGVSAYLRMMWADFFFPAGYGIALASAITLLAIPRGEAPNKKVLILMLLPLIAGLCDMVENIFHLFLLQNPQNLPAFPTLLAASFASVKWLLLFASALIIVAYSFLSFRRR